MAARTGSYVWDESYDASADLSAKQFYGVKLHTVAGQVALGAAVTDIGLGILQDKPKSGEAGLVRKLGISKAVVDANSVNIAIGDRLGLSANGRLVKAHTADRPNLAIAQEAATADAVVISVEIIPGNTPFRTPA